MRKLIKFEKYSVVGNDFILIATQEPQLFSKQVICHLCDRKKGIGSDGILFFTLQEGAIDYRMTFFNPDGSPAAMCGNGARAVLFHAGMALERQGEFNFVVGDKLYTGRITDGEYSINMGKPHIDEIDIDDLIEKKEVAACIDSGVPYVVLLTEKVSTDMVISRGARIRNDKRFPLGTNVVFLEQQADEVFCARIFERGVEQETLSSGTGATAAIFFIEQVLHKNCKHGLEMPGGILQTTRDANEDYWLTGDVKRVFWGEFWL